MKNAVLIVALLAWPLVGQTQDTLSPEEYREEVRSLLTDWLKMSDNLVFADESEVRALASFAEVPAGAGQHYSWPDGRAWLDRLSALQSAEVTGGPFAHCVEGPPFADGGVLCADELIRLRNDTLPEFDWDSINMAIGKVWLFLICAESPQACEPYIPEAQF